MAENTEPAGVQEDDLAQALDIGRRTTFEQRFRWLEQMIEAWRPQLLANDEQQRRWGI